MVTWFTPLKKTCTIRLLLFQAKHLWGCEIRWGSSSHPISQQEWWKLQTLTCFKCWGRASHPNFLIIRHSSPTCTTTVIMRKGLQKIRCSTKVSGSRPRLLLNRIMLPTISQVPPNVVPNPYILPSARSRKRWNFHINILANSRK